MNNYILAALLIVVAAFTFFDAPKAKAGSIDWGITVTIPGQYRDDRYDNYSESCWTIQRNYERATDRGRYNKARYWERRWYAADCNRSSYYDNHRRWERHGRYHEDRRGRRHDEDRHNNWRH